MGERIRRFLIYVMPALVYAAAIFTVSSIPKAYPPPLGVSWDDKIYHFIEYAGFSLLLFRALHFWRFTSNTVRRAFLTVLIASITAMVDELHQLYIGGRFAEVSDWIADFAGILFSVALVCLYIRAKKQRRNLR